MLGNDADLVVIKPDHPASNLQKSISSTTKVMYHTKGCTILGDILRSDYAHDEPRSKNRFCDACC